MNDEKREIRKMINEIAQNAEDGNYATNRNNDELCDYVTYVHKRSTGLSKDIIVDCGENYKYYNHPLCIYVVGDDNVSVYPVTVSTTPQAPFGNNIPSDIVAFVQNSVNILKGVADIEIGAGDFFNYLHEYRDRNEQKTLVGEMSNIPPQETGLSVWVYVDDTGSFKTCGHSKSYRIKFQQDKDVKNQRLWMPVAIPSLEIKDNDKLPPCKISQKEVNSVITWAKGNLKLLLQLRDNKIDGDTFKAQMLKLNDVKVLLDSELNKSKEEEKRISSTT